MIPVLAHGIGERADLPLPAWLVAYGAGFAVVISFVALGIFWPKPRLASAAVGRELPGVVQSARVPFAWLLRAVGLFVYGVVVVACIWAPNDSAVNIAPYIVYVTFWVGMIVVSAVIGDLYRVLNPLDSLSWVILGRRHSERTDRADPGLWLAALMIGSFAWMELCYFVPDSPRALGVWLFVYSVLALAGAAWWGRGWLRDGEGFAALFGLLGAIAPFFREPESGRLRARWPFSGLATVTARRGMAALVLVALGSTTFDGLQRASFKLPLVHWSFAWGDVVGRRRGWEATLVNTIGMAFVILVVALLWLLATRWSAARSGDDPAEVGDAYVPSLVPIVFAYAVAHYFSLLVFETYNNIIPLTSDPFSRGWDLFGTIDNSPDFTLLSTSTIAWVQAGAIVLGHIAGVVVAHDRALERHRNVRIAARSQHPLVAVMVVYTVVGLLLLYTA